MSKAHPLLVTRPATGNENETIRGMIERIFNNWKLCTPKQLGVASTLHGYYKPAEMATSKQMFIIEQALAIIMLAQPEPEDEI